MKNTWIRGRWIVMMIVILSLKGRNVIAIDLTVDSVENKLPTTCFNSLFFSNIENSCAGNIRFDSKLFWGSNVADNNLLGTIYNSGKITNDQKERTLARFDGKGRVGGGLKYSVSYFNKIGKDSSQQAKGLGFYLAYQEVQQLDVSFSKELFSLVFYGNSRYKGETVKVGGFYGNITHFQSLKFGISKSAKKTTFGMGVSFIRGINNTSIGVDRADLYTAKDPKKLKLNLDMEVLRSDTNSTFKPFAGQGVATDIYFNWKISPIYNLGGGGRGFWFCSLD